MDPARIAVVDRIMAALSDGPATIDELCARIGSVCCTRIGTVSGREVYTVRASTPADLADVLDDLSLAHAIGGTHVFPDEVDQDGHPVPPIIRWVRLLPPAAVVDVD